MLPLADFLSHRAGYKQPEIDAILAQPELQAEAVQKELLGVLRQPGSPASIRRAFETQLALHVKPVPAEAVTDAPAAEVAETAEETTADLAGTD